MIREDLYTGEVVNDPISPGLNDEIQAEEYASFGKYAYTPGYQQPAYTMYPGGYGYNPIGQSPINPISGIGMSPPVYNNAANPAFGYINAQTPSSSFKRGFPTEEDIKSGYKTISVPVNPIDFASSSVLPEKGFQEKIERLELEFLEKMIQSQYDQSRQPSYGGGYQPYYSGYNYYGVAYSNPYNSSNMALINEYRDKCEAIKQEAKERRLNLQKHLSKLAHNYLNDGVTDEQIEELYNGDKTIEIPVWQTPEYYHHINRIQNMVPFDNTQYYVDHDRRVSEEFNSIIPKDSDMKTCFANLGLLWHKWEREEEQKARKDMSLMYTGKNGAYRHYVRTMAKQRYESKNPGNIHPGFAPDLGGHNYPGENIKGAPPKGDELDNAIANLESNLMSEFPILSENATIKEDGSINITYGFGPNKGQSYNNSQEQEYDQKRREFLGFLNSIPDASGLMNANPAIRGCGI